eukprot:gene30447-35457_t
MKGVALIRFLKGRISSKGFRFNASRTTQVSKIDLPVLEAVARTLSEPLNPLWFTAGSCVFGALLLLLGAAPGLLPHVFLVFFATALPWRAFSFVRRKFTFFLVDYCYVSASAPDVGLSPYLSMAASCAALSRAPALLLFAVDTRFANCLVAGYFIRQLFVGQSLDTPSVCSGDQCPLQQATAPSQLEAGLQAAVYMLAEGPLAAALIPWQCSWVMDSASHSISVLMHLLPGLAMFAHRWLAPGVSLESGLSWLWAALTWDPTKGGLGQELNSSSAHDNFLQVEGFQASLIWLLGAPLAVYCLWQALYGITVQLVFRRFILSRGYTTSYSSLASKAAKANSFLNNFVRRGSSARRVCIFGLFQLAFTLLTFVIGFAAYRYFHLALLWTAVKIVVPLYYGSKYTKGKVPADAFKKGVKHLIALQLASDSLLLKDARPMPLESRSMASEWVPNTRFTTDQSS